MADFVVERSEKIAAPPAEVFERVGTLQAWDEWSPWAEMDPDMNKSYSGEAGEVGSSYHWSGNRKVGEGKMTITETDGPNRIAIDLSFIKPFKSDNVTELTVNEVDGGSEVTWRMTGPMTFMTKVMGWIGKTMDKMVGPDFEKGLAKLKLLSEA
jgi:hypothetical protein